jgi:hypothetical protein
VTQRVLWCGAKLTLPRCQEFSAVADEAAGQHYFEDLAVLNQAEHAEVRDQSNIGAA